MRRREVDIDNERGGGGDMTDSKASPEQFTTTPSDTENDEFTLSYGNYGDPHSFAPYQLFLLLVDFIFNWTMDLAHEDPLAVLVIFIFQSLAIIINLILYIMASASQAMQAGLQKRITIHHWLNLCTCLLYMILTGWWFIWALRKSWPSVSDQFSFTWPATDLDEIARSTLSAAVGSKNRTAEKMRAALKSSNVTRGPTNSTMHPLIKEHYTLWSPGFNALYVIHRTLAILYYFIYLRSTFLVLNTPAMDKFMEKKKRLVERFEEARKIRQEPEVNDGYAGGQRKKRGRLTSSMSFPVTSVPSFGLDEYLSNPSSAYFLDKEGSRERGSRKKQILWADNDDDEHEGAQRDDNVEKEDVRGNSGRTTNVQRNRKEEGRRRRGSTEIIEEDEQAEVEVPAQRHKGRSSKPIKSSESSEGHVRVQRKSKREQRKASDEDN